MTTEHEFDLNASTPKVPMSDRQPGPQPEVDRLAALDEVLAAYEAEHGVISDDEVADARRGINLSTFPVDLSRDEFAEMPDFPQWSDAELNAWSEAKIEAGRELGRQQAEQLLRGQRTLVCQCCGVIASFDALDDALEASWDVPPAFQVTICPSCSSALFVLGQQADCPHHRRTDG